MRRIAVLCAIFSCANRSFGQTGSGQTYGQFRNNSAGCCFGLAAGVDYPKPIVDHATVHKVNVGRMKASYDRKLYGQPVAATASHPLAPALRQVGCASEGETDTGTASAADGCGPSAAKKSRK